ncbi:MaoC family dehydratase [Citreimonas sp.]|uniref:MaoC family dehydratase n=1 Tax=Citreimonas sp. TaxID=3036715 RepID=UPI0040596F88
MRYFEDFPAGTRFRTGTERLSKDDIIAFARDHDPQPFHVDPDAAATSPFGGLIASGFHTMLVAFRLSLRDGGWAEASMGSPGMDEIRWLRPVRPGSTLHVEGEVVSARPSASKPDRGYAEIAYSVMDKQHNVVMTYRATHILRRRPN